MPVCLDLRSQTLTPALIPQHGAAARRESHLPRGPRWRGATIGCADVPAGFPAASAAPDVIGFAGSPSQRVRSSF
jgi:hypothetical protein